MSTLEEYRHLWDGSQPGWRLHHTDCVSHRITFQFADNGPTKSEVLSLKKLLDEFRDEPMHLVLKQLRGRGSFTIPREFSNLEKDWLVRRAEKTGLVFEIESTPRGGYIPVSADGHALIIENDALALQVAHKMIAAGVPVDDVHVD